MVVTPCTCQGQSHPGGRERIEPIDDVLDPELFGDAAALAIGPVIAIESCRQHLFRPRAGQQVTGKLLNREPIKRHVVVDRVDNPIPPSPHHSWLIVLVTVGVGVAGQVEPVTGEMFTKPWRAQQAIDQSFVPVSPAVGHRHCHQAWLWGQPGQCQRDPPDQSRPATRLRRHKTVPLQPGLDKVIDGVARPPSDARGCRRHRCPADRPQ